MPNQIGTEQGHQPGVEVEDARRMGDVEVSVGEGTEVHPPGVLGEERLLADDVAVPVADELEREYAPEPDQQGSGHALVPRQVQQGLTAEGEGSRSLNAGPGGH